MLTGIEKIGLALMIFVLMIGMGATLTWSDFIKALKHPKALLIGFLSQFGFMPLIAFGLSSLFNLPNAIALSLILVGSTPGGTTSNLFTYFSKGDVALSITMTVASTFAAVVMMPFILFLYASQFTQSEFIIPFKNIVSTLVIILIPVIIGMFVRKKSLSVANKLEKAGSYSGIIVIVFLLVEFIIMNQEVFKKASASIYSSAILLGLIGFFFGYFVSKALKLPERQSRTVALETGIQNTPLTMAIIVASFSEVQQKELLLLPMLYALFIVVDSALVTSVFRWLTPNRD